MQNYWESIRPLIFPSDVPNIHPWMQKLTNIVLLIQPLDITSKYLKNVATAIFQLKNEAYKEMESKIDRSGSVYDRPDYVVRECLRLSKIQFLLQYCRQVSKGFMSGDLVISDKGELVNQKTKFDPFITSTLLVEIPTLLCLCFTAKETVGIINIDEFMQFSSEILSYIQTCSHLSINTTPPQLTIFSAPSFILNQCLQNLLSLNTELFFVEFSEKSIFKLLTQTAVRSSRENQSILFDNTIECMCSFIQASQSEPERKHLIEDNEFVNAYKTLVNEVINPLLKTHPEMRSKFRSILFYSRSLR